MTFHFLLAKGKYISKGALGIHSRYDIQELFYTRGISSEPAEEMDGIGIEGVLRGGCPSFAGCGVSVEPVQPLCP